MKKKLLITCIPIIAGGLIYIFGVPFLTDVRIIGIKETYEIGEPVEFNVLVSAFGKECETFRFDFLGNQSTYKHKGGWIHSPCEYSLLDPPILYTRVISYPSNFANPLFYDESGTYVMSFKIQNQEFKQKFIVSDMQSVSAPDVPNSTQSKLFVKTEKDDNSNLLSITSTEQIQKQNLDTSIKITKIFQQPQLYDGFNEFIKNPILQITESSSVGVDSNPLTYVDTAPEAGVDPWKSITVYCPAEENEILADVISRSVIDVPTTEGQSNIIIKYKEMKLKPVIQESDSTVNQYYLRLWSFSDITVELPTDAVILYTEKKICTTQESGHSLQITRYTATFNLPITNQ